MNDTCQGPDPSGHPRTAHRAYGRHLHLAAAGDGDRGRPELEQFIQQAFARTHSAQVHSFMPSLLGFRDGQQCLRGVLGLRAASQDALYLEHYLDAPVESVLAAHTGRPLARTDIVEVGNLAARNCRTAVRMMAQLPAYLMARKFSWIVFTATRTVRQILLGFGAPLVELARADGARIASGVDTWGGYYDHDPRVYAGYLPDSGHLPGFDHGGADH